MIDEILNQIDRYLQGRASFRDLETWVVARIQSVYNSGDQRAMSLIDAVDVALMRASNREISASELCDELLRAARLSATYLVGKTALPDSTSSGNTTVNICYDERPIKDYYLPAVAG